MLCAEGAALYAVQWQEAVDQGPARQCRPSTLWGRFGRIGSPPAACCSLVNAPKPWMADLPTVTRSARVFRCRRRQQTALIMQH